MVMITVASPVEILIVVTLMVVRMIKVLITIDNASSSNKSSITSNIGVIQFLMIMFLPT